MRAGPGGPRGGKVRVGARTFPHTRSAHCGLFCREGWVVRAGVRCAWVRVPSLAPVFWVCGLFAGRAGWSARGTVRVGACICPRLCDCELQVVFLFGEYHSFLSLNIDPLSPSVSDAISFPQLYPRSRLPSDDFQSGCFHRPYGKSFLC